MLVVLYFIIEETGLNNPEGQYNMSAKIYMIYLIIIHPLLIFGGYFGVAKTKFLSLIIASVIYFLAQIIEFAFGQVKHTKIRKMPTAILLCVLLVVVLLSTFLSDYQPYVYLGFYGWWNGTLTIIVCIATMLVMSMIPEKSSVDPAKICEYSFIGAILPSLLAVADVMGADLFGWRGVLEWSDRSIYTSTVGNYAWLSSLLMIELPFILKGYRLLKERSQKELSILCDIGLFITFVCYNAVATDISIVSLCLSLCLLIVIFSRDRSEKRVLMLLKPVVIYFLSTVFLWVCFANMRNAVIRDGIIEYSATNGRLSIITLFVLIILGVCAEQNIKRIKGQKRKHNKRKGNTGVCVKHGFQVMLCILITVITLAGVILSPFISDKFGSGRGYIWHTALYALRSRGIRDLLIGSGPDTFYTIFNNSVSSGFDGQILTVAHNVFLNLFINIGFLAAIVFLVLVYNTVNNCILKMKNDEIFIYYMAAIIGAASFFSVGYINSVMMGMVIILVGRVSVKQP